MIKIVVIKKYYDGNKTIFKELLKNLEGSKCNLL